MGLYTEQLLPRLLDYAMRGARFDVERAPCVGAARGCVLEIGFGSGHNLRHYPDTVTELFALEPSALARRLARKRVVNAPFPVRFLALQAERIPLAPASIDTVISTFTLCTIADPGAALAEVRRVLRPGGQFLFVEHGRAPDARVARWQDRLDPLQQRLAGGCHLNREIDALVRDAGLELDLLDQSYMEAAPRIAGYLYRGRARSQGEGGAP